MKRRCSTWHATPGIQHAAVAQHSGRSLKRKLDSQGHPHRAQPVKQPASDVLHMAPGPSHADALLQPNVKLTMHSSLYSASEWATEASCNFMMPLKEITALLDVACLKTS